MRSPDGIIRFAVLESVSPVVEVGFYVSMILDSALQTLVPWAYALFVLVYTTRTDRSEQRLLFILASFGLLYTAGTAYVTLISLAPSVLPAGLRAVVSDTFVTFLQFAVTVSLFVTGALVLLALGQLWRTLYQYEFVPKRLTLSVAVIVPPVWLAEGFLVGVTETPVSRAATPIPFLGLSVVVVWLAVNQFGLFDELPAASAVARRDIVGEMADAAIAVTDEQRVVDWNGAAVSLFGQKYETVVGDSLTTAMPDTFDIEALLSGEQKTCQLPQSDRLLEASAGQITDDDGRVLGHTLTFRDITARRRNARRAEVLNRVLRHNLRNKVDVATAHLQQLNDEDCSENHSETVAVVREHLSDLRNFGTTAREIESVLQADQCGEEHSVEELAHRAIEAVPQAHCVTEQQTCDLETASIPVVTDIPSVMTSANREILIPVIRELVSNAVEHGGGTPDPCVTVRAVETVETDQAEEWQIEVTDTGPGINDHEMGVFEQAKETKLHHGSGLGLWLVWWGVDRLGGEVGFAVDSGTTVTVTLPGRLFECD
jgi:PAS domain S-box-containing protein